MTERVTGMGRSPSTLKPSRYSSQYTQKLSGAQTHSKAARIRETGGHDWTGTHRAAKRTVSRSAPNKTNYREEAEAAGFALT